MQKHNYMTQAIKMILIVTGVLMFSNLALAAGAPFDKADAAGNDVLTFLRGGFARTFIALAITWAGYKLVVGTDHKKAMFAIIGAGLLIGMAPTISDWLIKIGQ